MYCLLAADSICRNLQDLLPDLPSSTLRKESVSDILRKWKLIDGDVVLNGATALFTKEVGMYTQFTLRMARFAGTDKNEFIDNQRVEGNLFELLNEAMGFCRKHLNMSGKIVGLVREEHLDIPAEALREALLNALCHRWYEHYNITIGLAIYDDRIEIENPGMMPPQIDMEHIEQAHYSSPHNPRMANVLYQTGYIENWGSGIQRIIATCQKYDVALPTWQQMPGNVVVVTFARNTAQTELNDNNNFGNNFGKDFGKDFGKELTDRQRIILKILAEDGSLSAKSLSEKISEKNSGKKLTDRTIEKDLAALKDLGYLTREGGRKEGRWVVDMKV